MLAPYDHLVAKAIREKHIDEKYIGLDACAANLMRPAVNGAYHHITVAGKENQLLMPRFFRSKRIYHQKMVPRLFTVKRKGRDYKTMRADGEISEFEDKVYDVISRYDGIPMHEIKIFGGFASEDKTQFDKALIGLQMKLLITMCGSAQKKNRKGEEYGWNSTVFCTAEDFWAVEKL